jgi:Zn-dependent protease with chaperone function
MKRGDHEERLLAGQARLAAFVIAGAMLMWMAAQWLGGQMGWQARYVFLFDLAAMAAFFWGLVVTYRVWRKRRSN